MSDQDGRRGEEFPPHPEAAIEGLVGQLEGVDFSPTDPTMGDAFGSWWRRAARAAALGRPEPFQRWPRLADELRLSWRDVVVASGRSILGTLETVQGLEGDRAVIDAEDLRCLYAIESEVTGLITWDPAVTELIGLVVGAAARAGGARARSAGERSGLRLRVSMCFRLILRVVSWSLF